MNVTTSIPEARSRPFRDRVGFSLSYPALLVLSYLTCLCSAPVLKGIGKALSWVWFDGLRIRRRLILKNLEIAYGTQKSLKEKRQIARQSIYHLLLSFFEVLVSRKIDLTPAVSMLGEEILRQQVLEGRGFFILCAHLGNWELLGAKLSRSIIPVHVLVKQHNSRGAQRFLSEVRRHNGFIEIARNQKGDGVKGILKALGKGEGIGYVLDQTRPGEERVPFFGFGAKTNTGLAALWCRKDVPIIPASIRRLDFANHEITFHEPLDLSSFNRERQDLLPLTEYFNEVLQNMILANPWQYLWVHDRWK